MVTFEGTVRNGRVEPDEPIGLPEGTRVTIEVVAPDEVFERKEQNTEADLVDGRRGELTVLVDGREVARKEGDNLPDPQQVLEAVRSVRHEPAARS